MAERRVDPEDGVAYTYDELVAYYKGKYKKQVIAEYWEECEPVNKGKKSKSKAAPEPKAKAKAKAKAEPKAKAKAKAEPEPKAKAKAKAKAEAEPKAKAKAKAKAKKDTKPAGGFKVCVCGGAGMDSNVGELCIFDLDVAMVPPAGVAADLGHLERKCSVKGYTMPVGKSPAEYLEECLTGCHLVLVPAGVPRKPGMTRDDLFKTNAGIAKGIVEACAKFCP
eukprot:CAMPEP_0176229180 /NCGR_PEP_ID=MMETSP0121_2-20121125/23656_1 /TAXON_ID=160619 /ORGANISM="Kryptoperidinium foliaceum, Strain CCMP 1326" /LENGTH=221 /DNA_ID=CAMNT_0017568495 /DNA_START=93 /DNA_END=754 /DNA_ORIENTATION=-